MCASEIWGTVRLDGIEKVHLMACKRFLGVPLRTPNKVVYGELGRYPLFCEQYTTVSEILVACFKDGRHQDP